MSVCVWPWCDHSFLRTLRPPHSAFSASLFPSRLPLADRPRSVGSALSCLLAAMCSPSCRWGRSHPRALRGPRPWALPVPPFSKPRGLRAAVGRPRCTWDPRQVGVGPSPQSTISEGDEGAGGLQPSSAPALHAPPSCGLFALVPSFSDCTPLFTGSLPPKTSLFLTSSKPSPSS